MRLRKHLDARKIFIAGYFGLFIVYLIIGFQPADATHYEITGMFSIPAVNINTEVANAQMTGNAIETPPTIAGEYSIEHNKTLLIGHSTTVFQNLFGTKIGDIVEYNNNIYIVQQIELREKDTIRMSDIMKGEEKDTIIIMTCAGELYDDGDASHRYMITAVTNS